MNLRHRCEGHNAAVKAMAWCPWQQNILVSGGGTNDKKLNLWNADSGECIRSVDSGSQVCAVQFLEKHKELITSHGFSKYQISIWNTNNFTKQP